MHGWIAGGSYEITGGLVGRTSDGGISSILTRGSPQPAAVRFS